MTYSDEKKEQLKDVSRELCVAFAVRSALRVLPLLATDEKKGGAFWYWDEQDRHKHFLSVLIAIQTGLRFIRPSSFFLGAAAYAANATNAADDAIKRYYRDETKKDLVLLQHTTESENLFKEPLWTNGMPEELSNIWQRFQQWAKSLDAGFEIWLDWHQQRLDGEPIDFDLLDKQVNIPAELKTKVLRQSMAT